MYCRMKVESVELGGVGSETLKLAAVDPADQVRSIVLRQISGDEMFEVGQELDVHVVLPEDHHEPAPLDPAPKV